MSQLILSGVTLTDLLLQIEQLLDSKIGIQHQQEKQNQSGYITRKEASRLLHITLPTLHDYTKQGWLTSYKIGTRVLYKEALEKVQSFKHKKGGFTHGA